MRSKYPYLIALATALIVGLAALGGDPMDSPVVYAALVLVSGVGPYFAVRQDPDARFAIVMSPMAGAVGALIATAALAGGGDGSGLILVGITILVVVTLVPASIAAGRAADPESS